MEDKNPRILHGNNARIDPKKRPASYFASNMAANQNENNDKTEAEREEMVEYAREFVEENKK